MEQERGNEDLNEFARTLFDDFDRPTLASESSCASDTDVTLGSVSNGDEGLGSDRPKRNREQSKEQKNANGSSSRSHKKPKPISKQQSSTSVGIKPVATSRKREGGRLYISVDPVRLKLEGQVQRIMKNHSEALQHAVSAANMGTSNISSSQSGGVKKKGAAAFKTVGLLPEIKSRVRAKILGSGFVETTPGVSNGSSRALDPDLFNPLDYFKTVVGALNAGSLSDVTTAIRRFFASDCIVRTIFLMNNDPNLNVAGDKEPAAADGENSNAPLFTDSIVIGHDDIIQMHRGLMDSFPDCHYILDNARYVNSTGGDVAAFTQEELIGIVAHFKFQGVFTAYCIDKYVIMFSFYATATMVKAVWEDSVESKYTHPDVDDLTSASVKSQRPDMASIASTGCCLLLLNEGNEIEYYYVIYSSQAKPVGGNFAEK